MLLRIGAAVVAIVIVQVAVEMVAAGMIYIALAAEVAAPVAIILLLISCALQRSIVKQ